MSSRVSVFVGVRTIHRVLYSPFLAVLEACSHNGIITTIVLPYFEFLVFAALSAVLQNPQNVLCYFAFRSVLLFYTCLCERVVAPVGNILTDEIQESFNTVGTFGISLRAHLKAT